MRLLFTNPAAHLFKHSVLMFVVSALVGCSTLLLTEKRYDCKQLDWFEVGRGDGVRGFPSVSWEKKESTCSGFSDYHHESYKNGWFAGIVEFCTFENAFAYGKSGQTYTGVCPTGQEHHFKEGFELGQKIYQIESENLNLSQEIRVLQERQLDPTRLKQLETQLNKNQTRIGELQGRAQRSNKSKKLL